MMSERNDALRDEMQTVTNWASLRAGLFTIIHPSIPRHFPPCHRRQWSFSLNSNLSVALKVRRASSILSHSLKRSSAHSASMKLQNTHKASCEIWFGGIKTCCLTSAKTFCFKKRGANLKGPNAKWLWWPQTLGNQLNQRCLQPLSQECHYE